MALRKEQPFMVCVSPVSVLRFVTRPVGKLLRAVEEAIVKWPVKAKKVRFWQNNPYDFAKTHKKHPLLAKYPL